jgi:peroxiredoxin
MGYDCRHMPANPVSAARQAKSSARIRRVTALQDQLDEITANTRNLVQPERMAVSERAVAELFASGIEDKILPVGAIAPEFTLPDASGRPVRSADLLALGPLVLNFFRGRWCAYCVTELEAWRDLYPRLREAGALLAAIGPQTARQSDFMVGQHSLPFPVLTDPGCALGEKFGLAYTIPQYHRDYYRSILVNIPFVNGDQSWRLTLPATYTISPAGRVVYAQAFADFRVRPEPEEVLAVALAAVGR